MTWLVIAAVLGLVVVGAPLFVIVGGLTALCLLFLTDLGGFRASFASQPPQLVLRVLRGRGSGQLQMR